MKIKKIYILITVIVIIILPIFVKKYGKKTFKINNINYAVSVNGASQASFPSKGSYDVKVRCSNATANWNYQDWVAEISNVTGAVNCDIKFTSKTKVNFNTYLINLLNGATSVSASTKEVSDGSVLAKVVTNLNETINGFSASSTNYRYRGPDPNNYVIFNGELWRIIGVFDQYAHGVSGAKLVKIIRNDSIGVHAWDGRDPSNLGGTQDGVNNYYESYIYQILNTGYYTAISARTAAYCIAQANCDFRKIGIQTASQSMIETGVNWYLGGAENSDMLAADMFRYERGTTTYNSSVLTYYKSTAEAGLTAPIGLMYPSDYGYSMLSSCGANLSARNVAGCLDKGWLRSNTGEWTITHCTDNIEAVFIVTEDGTISTNTYSNVNGGYINVAKYAVRPTLYLKSTVYYVSGTGTQTDPYIIAV